MHPLLSIGSMNRIFLYLHIPGKIIFKYFFYSLYSQVGFHKANELKIRYTKCTKCIFSLFVYEDKVVLLLQNTPNLQWTQKEKHRLVGPRRLFSNTFFAIYTAKLAFIRQMSWKFDTQSALNVFFSLFKFKDKVVCLLQNTSHLQWTKKGNIDTSELRGARITWPKMVASMNVFLY